MSPNTTMRFNPFRNGSPSTPAKDGTTNPTTAPNPDADAELEDKSHHMPQCKVRLDVSGRIFLTTTRTLLTGFPYIVGRGSAWFARHLDPEAAKVACIEDSVLIFPVYLDLDADTFAHVLDYLKTGVMPFLYRDGRAGQPGGFDVVAYAKIERMAIFWRLSGWRGG
jgi:hypothetical protein